MSRSLTKKELKKVAEFLKSEEGIKELRNALNKNSNVEAAIKSMNIIKPKILKKPFTI